MGTLWSFVRQKRNREILGWAGGGLVVAVAGLWAAIVYFFPVSGKPGGAQANCGTAIGGSVIGSNVETKVADCVPKSK